MWLRWSDVTQLLKSSAEAVAGPQEPSDWTVLVNHYLGPLKADEATIGAFRMILKRFAEDVEMRVRYTSALHPLPAKETP